MTVDRTHVLATPGMDTHGSDVALSWHRDGMDLHYGRDDFAGRDRLVRTLSRDRAKDMATDYEPARSYAEQRGITFRERVVETVRKVVPEKRRGVFDGLRHPADGVPGSDAVRRPERESAGAETRHDSAAPARESPSIRRPRYVEPEPPRSNVMPAQLTRSSARMIYAARQALKSGRN